MQLEEPVIEARWHSVRGVKEQHRMLIPSIEMLRHEIEAVPAGARKTLADIRRGLASRHGADACCPVTIQRHLTKVAEEAFATFELTRSAAAITPFWRIVDPEKPNSRRLAGGAAFIRQQLGEDKR